MCICILERERYDVYVLILVLYIYIYIYTYIPRCNYYVPSIAPAWVPRHPVPRGLQRRGQSPYWHYGFRRVWLKHNINSKGWNSQARREFPGKFESSNLNRDNLSREIGCIQEPSPGESSWVWNTLEYIAPAHGFQARNHVFCPSFH